MLDPLGTINAGEKALQAFCLREDVELMILFGSGAVGGIHAESDLDIALQFSREKTVSKLHLIFELETILDPWTVDPVIITPETPPLLLHEIFKDGRVIFEKAEGLFERGKLRAWRLYVDSAPLREKTREYVLRTLERLGHVP